MRKIMRKISIAYNMFAACLKNYGILNGIYLFIQISVIYTIGFDAFPKKIRKFSIKHMKKEVFYRPFTTDSNLIYNILSINSEYSIPLDDSKFDMILDLGANIGLFTVLFAYRYPEKTIVAVEPESSNFNVLTLNTKMLNNCQILKYAIWWRKARLNIVNVFGGGDWAFQVIETDEPKYDVDGIDIDTLVKLCINENEQTSTKRLLIKMDIEGAENIIFQHISSASWIDHTSYLIIEIHNDEHPDLYKKICGIMYEHGFNSSFCGENVVFYK